MIVMTEGGYEGDGGLEGWISRVCLPALDESASLQSGDGVE
jgi:hypothetical protein